ncbi:MAG: S41 family peptidase [Myxococcaceae bacterium]|jgi:carboxyl-terminal processing protease|nr:S41 family peptidase [Myxococcaceae bacterium]
MHMLRRVLVVAALIIAWALAGNDRVPLSLTMSKEAEAAPGRGGDESKSTHELSALRVLTKVILYVKDNYVDPKRVRPKEMMVAALEAVEKSVPEVMVDGSADSGKVRLNVNGKAREFDISHVDTLWRMSFTMKDVFDFISRNMRPTDDTREIEYAAVNGMLNTLDPHSILLRPEMYREMKLSTKGEFGGLGFVIQMREGILTVVKVLPKTPAFRAGIKKDDQITRIGEESTVNMDLNEAVGKLRGPVDSRVTITVNRKGWDKPQVMTLTRALITIESVQSKLLASNVGYVRIKNFQGNTTRDLQTALMELGAQAKTNGAASGLKGVVLDLRGNPGGLLDQAIQVSDVFVSSGTIVATVGLSDKLREEKKAHPDDDDDAYPVAVLVNAGSASASEIVAGALKNLNRAVIIGRQTFGKGSVQVLYDFPDESALKLTIAKYLTPGDISIQEVGITPDIQLTPTRVSKDRVDVFAPRKSMGEADLESHFGNPSNDKAAKKREDVVVREKPVLSLKYLKEEKEKVAKAPPEEKKDPKAAATPPKGKAPAGKNVLTDSEGSSSEEDLDDQLDAESQDEVREDFEVTFARDFLLTAPFTRRDKMIEAGKKFVNDTSRKEEDRIANAITALGIDWSPGPSPKKPSVESTLKPNVDRKIVAGETVQLELTAENKGSEPIKRLRAWIESENGYLDRREFLFGALKPGEQRTWTVSVKLPKDLISRRDGVTVKFQDDSGVLQEALAGELNFVELPKPRFAYSWQLVDDCQACNQDGVAQRGESVTLLLDVTNVGGGKALDTFAMIRNTGEPNIFIEKGRFKVGELEAGETKTARFSLEVKKALKPDEFGLRVNVLDEPLEEFLTDKLVIPVDGASAPVALEPKKGVVKVAEKAEVYASADPRAPVIARLPKGAVLSELARGSTVARVELAENRPAFVKIADLRDARGQKPVFPKDKELEVVPFRAPALISVNLDPAQGGTAVDGANFTLSSVVTDPTLLDVFVLVNDQKVFFKGRTPDDGDKLKFTTEFPLKEGNNFVTVIARETQDFATRKTVVIRRRAPAVAANLSDEPPKQAKP